MYGCICVWVLDVLGLIDKIVDDTLRTTERYDGFDVSGICGDCIHEIRNITPQSFPSSFWLWRRRGGSILGGRCTEKNFAWETRSSGAGMYNGVRN